MKKKPEPQLEWKRAKKDETTCAHRRTWESRCGHYIVQESVGKFSEMGTTYYAMHDDCGRGWFIVGRHRNRNSAEMACEKYEQAKTK